MWIDKKREKNRKLYLIVQCQPMTVEWMVDLEYHPLSAIIVIIDSEKNQQWTLKLWVKMWRETRY